MKEKQERNLPVYSTGLSDFLYPYETESDFVVLVIIRSAATS